MGTEVSVLVPGGDAERAEALVRDLFEEWEQALSRFRPDSELSRLNDAAGGPVAVSPLLHSVADAAIAAARATDGLFDPTLLPDLARIGYDRTFAELEPDAAAPSLPRGGGGWRGVQLDPRKLLVTVPAGVALEFGGIAKGMAVDAALDLLRREGFAEALVDAGGDLGVQGGRVWPVAVEEVPGLRIPLARGAVATSGTGRRRWLQHGRPRHHLVDPRSGEPARTDLRAATVVAATCRQAEVAATVAMLLGSVAAEPFLRERGLTGILLTDDRVSLVEAA